MMEVQKFLHQYGLERLKEDIKIEIRDYPAEKLVVLNYDMIESDKNNPIVKECRALILKKETWEVVARSFDRFMNVGEDQNTKDFPISNALIQEKLDGSICSFYFFDNKWNVSTRSMAFAEGETSLGRSFKEVFVDAAKKTKLFQYMAKEHLCIKGFENLEDFTFVFELTGPENRVVSVYPENTITLIGARNKFECNNYRELSDAELNYVAEAMNVKRPRTYKFSTIEETIRAANSLNAMDEGFVLVYEQEGSHWRIKCKNSKYLSIAHLRGNGQISPRRVLELVMKNDYEEFLSYFECDRPYFTFVEKILTEVKQDIVAIYDAHKDIAVQKDFAMAIMPKVKYSFEKGIIFAMRKGKTMEEMLRDIGAKDLSKALNLKQRFIEEFHMEVEDEEI